MTDTALHLAEKVFPQVMLRQWVCSLPWRLRALLGYDKTLCSEVLRAFTDEVGRSLRRRAKKVLGLVSVSEAHTGGITICQRFDSALRPGVHFHSLFLDGVYVECDDGSLGFHELPEPSPEQVADVARRTATSIRALLEEAKKSLDSEMADDGADALALDQPALAVCYGGAARGVDLTGERAGQPSLRLFQQDHVDSREPAAVIGGVNLHAGVAIDGRDRARLERAEPRGCVLGGQSGVFSGEGEGSPRRSAGVRACCRTLLAGQASRPTPPPSRNARLFSLSADRFGACPRNRSLLFSTRCLMPSTRFRIRAWLAREPTLSLMCSSWRSLA